MIALMILQEHLLCNASKLKSHLHFLGYRFFVSLYNACYSSVLSKVDDFATFKKVEVRAVNSTF